MLNFKYADVIRSNEEYFWDQWRVNRKRQQNRNIIQCSSFSMMLVMLLSLCVCFMSFYGTYTYPEIIQKNLNMIAIRDWKTQTNQIFEDQIIYKFKIDLRKNYIRTNQKTNVRMFVIEIFNLFILTTQRWFSNQL